MERKKRITGNSGHILPKKTGISCESSATRTIRKLKKGEYFRLNNSDTAPVWVRGEYVPAEKKFSIYQFDDVNNDRLCKGEKEVYIGFTF